MVESQPSKLLVASSILVSRSRYSHSGFAGVAQLVEHLICNQRVGGSNPSAGSSFLNTTQSCAAKSDLFTDITTRNHRGPATRSRRKLAGTPPTAGSKKIPLTTASAPPFSVVT